MQELVVGVDEDEGGFGGHGWSLVFCKRVEGIREEGFEIVGKE